MLFIDEISTTSVHLFGALNNALEAAFPHTGKPFGGKSIILLGDFCQIEPTDGKSLARLLACSKSGHKVHHKGLQSVKEDIEAHVPTFQLFQRFELTKQERCGECKVHQALLHAFKLKGGEKCPLTRARVDALQRLTPDLLMGEKFRDATFAVATNAERHRFNRSRTVAFAKRYGEPVFKWVLPVGDSQELARTCINLGAQGLEFYFVRGMPVVFNEKPLGIDASWQVVNQTPGFAHSFLLPEGADPLPSTWAAGEVIEVPMPEVVNVRVLLAGSKGKEEWAIIPSKAKSTTKLLAKWWTQIKREHGRFLQEVVKSSGDMKVTVQGMQKGNLPGKTHVLDPAFCVTYNKLQGVTVENGLVVVLTKNPKLSHLDLNKVFVALSRVKRAEDLAVMPPAEEKDFDHLTTLSWSEELIAWNEHYTDDGRWKSKEPVCLPSLARAFSAGVHASFVTRKKLVKLCRMMDIQHGGKTPDEMSADLMKPFKEFLAAGLVSRPDPSMRKNEVRLSRNQLQEECGRWKLRKDGKKDAMRSRLQKFWEFWDSVNDSGEVAEEGTSGKQEGKVAAEKKAAGKRKRQVGTDVAKAKKKAAVSTRKGKCRSAPAAVEPIDAALAIYGLISRDVAGDGECQFSALALHVGSTGASVRRKVVAEMKRNPSYYFQCWNWGHGTWNEYKEFLKRMEDRGCWGQDSTLQAAANCFGRIVRVVMVTGGVRSFRCSLHERKGDDIWLGYINHNHYRATCKLGIFSWDATAQVRVRGIRTGLGMTFRCSQREGSFSWAATKAVTAGKAVAARSGGNGSGAGSKRKRGTGTGESSLRRRRTEVDSDVDCIMVGNSGALASVENEEELRSPRYGPLTQEEEEQVRIAWDKNKTDDEKILGNTGTFAIQGKDVRRLEVRLILGGMVQCVRLLGLRALPSFVLLLTITVASCSPRRGSTMRSSTFTPGS